MTSPILYEPTQVLFELDGPAIFLHERGLSNQLFLKVDDDARSVIYLNSSITNNNKEALLASEVSVRGSFLDGSELRLVKLTHNFALLDTLEKYDDRFPSYYLPKSGVGIKFGKKDLPDAIIRKDAIFTIYLKGKDFSEDAMSLIALERYVGASRKALNEVFVKAKSLADGRRVNFVVAEPEFGSLSISVLDASVRARKHENYNELSKKNKEFHESFRDTASRLIETLNAISQSEAAEQITTDEMRQAVNGLSGLFPSLGGEISSLSLIGDGGVANSVNIKKSDVSRIKRFVEHTPSIRRTIVGGIIATNAKEGWIRLMLPDRRKVTAYIGRESFDLNSDNLVSGQNITITGNYHSRQRTDLMTNVVKWNFA